MFNLAQMAAILDFTQNPKSKNAFWPQHYMSGIPENPLVDTRMMNIMLKLYQMAAISFQPIYRSQSQF